MLVLQDPASTQHKAQSELLLESELRNQCPSPHESVVNIILNNILVQRGLIAHEQRWEERKTVRTGPR